MFVYGPLRDGLSVEPDEEALDFGSLDRLKLRSPERSHDSSAGAPAALARRYVRWSQHQAVVGERRGLDAVNVLEAMKPIGGSLGERRRSRRGSAGELCLVLLNQAVQLDERCLLVEMAVVDAATALCPLAAVVPFHPRGAELALDLPPR